MLFLKHIRRSFLLVGLCAAASLPVWAQVPAKPSVEAFFDNAAFKYGVLSRSGRHFALMVSPSGGRTQLMVLDVEKLTAKMVAGYSDTDVAWLGWVNDERLVYGVVDSRVGARDMMMGAGLQTVMRDGTGFREVFQRSQFAYVLGFTRHPSDDVFTATPRMDWDVKNGFTITRTNTRETVRRPRLAPPGNSFGWVLDHNDIPSVTITVNDDRDRQAVHYMEPGTDKWRQLAEFPLYEEKGEGIEPLDFAPDGTLHVLARNGSDKSSLYRYDLARGALDKEPLATVAGYDFQGELLFNHERLLGLRVLSDAQGTIWFDPGMKEVQKKVDALLPGTVNRITAPFKPQVPYVSVFAYSDVDPGNYHLYNTSTGKLVHVGAARRGIEPKAMSPREPVRYKARDGREIPGWLTVPRSGGRKNLPLVVLAHNGPWDRAPDWKWDAESQFLASRGYAVLEPDFRGSKGYGWEHYRAGWKQWGLAMQNDLADGAKWAVSQGLADPQRMCIAGHGYGGYAALMGLINDPELFRCGISSNGVTDLDLLYAVGWSNFSYEYKTAAFPRVIGDRNKDADQLKRTSPLTNAARIKQPVLLAHGGADQEVSVVHGTRLRDALQKTNPNVEWVEYSEEGHLWALTKNRVDFWTRVEKFLERNIGAK